MMIIALTIYALARRGLPRAHLDGRLAFDPATGVPYASIFDLGIYAFTPGERSAWR